MCYEYTIRVTLSAKKTATSVTNYFFVLFGGKSKRILIGDKVSPQFRLILKIVDFSLNEYPASSHIVWLIR